MRASLAKSRVLLDKEREKNAMQWFGRNTIQVLRVSALLLTAFYICSCAASTPNQELRFAAMKGRTETVKLLISKGIDVNSKNSAGYTSLHWAAQYGQIETVKILISLGAEVNSRTGATGETPLHLAAEEGQTGVIRILISNGADVNSRNKYGYSPLGATLIQWRKCRERSYPVYHACQKYEGAISLLEQSMNQINHQEEQPMDQFNAR